MSFNNERKCDVEEVIWKCYFAFLLSFVDYSNSSGFRNVYLLHYPGIKLVWAVWGLEKNWVNLKTSAFVLVAHTTAKWVISRRRED